MDGIGQDKEDNKQLVVYQQSTASPSKNMLLYKRKSEEVDELNKPKKFLTYLEKAKETEYIAQVDNGFFEERCLIMSFGLSTNYCARVGFDVYNQAYKLFVRRINIKHSATVLSLFLREIKQIMDFINLKLKQIEEKDINLPEYSEKELGNERDISFWEHPTTWFSPSMTTRARLVRTRLNNFQLVVNSPIVEISKYEKYLGPVLIWCQSDVEQFLGVIEKLTSNYEDVQL